MSCLIRTEPDRVRDDEILRLVDPRVKASDEEILDSIHGYEFIGVQRDKLEVIQTHMDNINACIGMTDAKLLYYRQKYAGTISHLETMIGISTKSALYIIGEIGTDMSVWRDSDSLASWAGLAPANNESAKKKKSTKIGKGGHYLKPLLVQCALAAVSSTRKDPYFYHKYQTLSKRRGHKKAVMAIARKMLVAIYHMIRDDADFLPADYDDTITRNSKHAELNLKNVIAFLGAHGAGAETIRMIEAQCAENETEAETGTGAGDKSRKKKQPRSDAGSSALPDGEAVRRKRSKKSPQTKDRDSSRQPASATATA